MTRFITVLFISSKPNVYTMYNQCQCHYFQYYFVYLLTNTVTRSHYDSHAQLPTREQILGHNGNCACMPILYTIMYIMILISHSIHIRWIIIIQYILYHHILRLFYYVMHCRAMCCGAIFILFLLFCCQFLLVCGKGAWSNVNMIR